MERLVEVLERAFRHRGKVVGALAGLVFGWMVVAYGLAKTLFILACLVAGSFIGAWADGDTRLPIGDRRRRY